jgi:3-hydroxy-9,10-secoandrosta-1,3,5(10)-triene-9,17-dione monooxygenase reductase component
VAIIASLDGDTPIGVSIGSFASVSMNPPLVAFFIADTSTTWPQIEQIGTFCVSILESRQEAMCRRFATSGADKFAGTPWRPSSAGNPIIGESIAWLDCTIESVSAAGDHRFVLGRIQSMNAETDGDPLVFLGGRYRRLDLTKAD